MGDLQTIGNNALQKAPQPLRRALDGLGVQFRGEGGPTQSIASGSQSGNLAGVLAHDPRTINVMDTGAFQKAPEQLATHEGMHLAQNNWAPSIQSAIPADNPADPYNYGGTEGVKRLLSQGKGIANMPREQAAAAMQYGQSQGMPEPYNQLAHTMDKIPLSQIDMTDPMAKTMNMHPRAPQVPPSSVPGMNFAKEIYQPGQPAPGDTSLLPPDMVMDQPASPAPAPAPAPGPLQQNIDRDQQKLQKVDWAQKNPWGTANNHPGTLGKIAHVLSVAGNIAGDIVAPNVMANIPGTQLGMATQSSGLTKRLNDETEEQSQNQGRDATTQATQLANTNEPQRASDAHTLSQAQAGNLQSETDARNHPVPKEPTNAFELWHKQNPNGTAEQFNALESHPLSQEDAASRNAVWDTIADKYHLPKGQFRAGMSGADAAALATGLNNVIGRNQGQEKIVIQQGAASRAGDKTRDANTEKAYTSAAKDLNSQFSAAQTQAETLATARQELSSGAVGQAAGTIKTLVGLAGGKGTGVRITQAELNAIAHARGIQGDFEGFINKLSGQGALSGPQLQQMDHLLSDVESKIHEKMAVQDKYLDRLSQAGSEQDIRQIQSEYRKESLSGGQPSGGNEPQRPANVPEGYKFNAHGPKGAGWYK